MTKRSMQPGLSDGTEVPKPAKKVKHAAKPKAQGPKKTSATSKTAKPKAVLEQNRIKVGVDYGTTNSGVAYVMSVDGSPEDVTVIKDWPGGLHGLQHLEKIPSRIAFAKENEGMGEDKFGYDVPPGSRSYSWTKLLLDNSRDRDEWEGDELTEKLRTGLMETPVDMTPEDVATAFLTKVYDHTVEHIERRMPSSYLAATPMDFWFTVPAMWEESAKDATLRIARNAGFGRRDGDTLSIITEPEAAAIAVLSQAIERNSNVIKNNTDVLILDLGGGTTDMQSLSVTKVKPNLQTDETVPGIGGKGGASLIDANLHKWLQTVFGDAFTKLPTTKTGPGSKFMNEWEIVKKSFSGKDLNKKHQIAFPALGSALQSKRVPPSEYDFEDHSVLINGHEIAKLFDPVVSRVYGLITKQLHALSDEGRPPLKFMCLCGGLGQSEYMWKRIEEYIAIEMQGKCRLFTDDRAWSAIIRGAAIRGLSGSLVLSKKAQRCYGIGVHQKFRDGIDDEEDAEWCSIKNEKRAKGYIYWPIEKGKPFTDDLKIKTKMYMAVPESDRDAAVVYEWKLYSTALNPPPDRVDHQAVKVEGTITIDLSGAPRKKIKKHGDSSDATHQAENIQVVFTMGGQRGTLQVEALLGRKPVGEAKIDYARTHERRVVARPPGLQDDRVSD